MKKNIIKAVIGCLLLIWCLFETVSGVTDPLTRNDAFAFFVGFIIIILPFLWIAVFISFSLRNSNNNLFKSLGTIGILISIIIAIVNTGVIIWNFVELLSY